MVQELTTQELEQKLKSGEPLNLIDVREVDEWQAGHIKEARNIPLSEIVQRVDEFPQEEMEIVLICRSGGRSGKACDYLGALGHTVINVTGGMLAWQGEVVTGE